MAYQVGPLNFIADVLSGFAFKSLWFQSGGDKIVRISDIVDERITQENCVCFDSDKYKIPQYCVAEEGDILMALSGATTGKIGVVTSNDSGLHVNQRIAIIRGKTQENKKYLKYIFSGANLRKLLLRAGGAAQANLSPNSLREMEIPLPPLSEQKRIAAILDKAEAIRRKCQAAIKLTDELLRATFLDMFGDPATNPKGWPIGTIRDLVSEVKYGTSKKANEHKGKFPILRMNNITYSGGLDVTELKYVNLDEKEEEKYLARKGDLLFNRTNSKELVGKTAVYDLEQKMAIAGYLIRVRSNEKSNPCYISAYLNSAHGKATLQGMCKSIIGMANINAQELQDIKILVPPVSLQNKYAELTAAVKRKSANLSKAIAQSQDLMNSLTQRAFRGEL